MVIRAPACLHSTKEPDQPPGVHPLELRSERGVGHHSRIRVDHSRVEALERLPEYRCLSTVKSTLRDIVCRGVHLEPHDRPRLVLAQGRVEYGASPHERIEHDALRVDARQLKQPAGQMTPQRPRPSLKSSSPRLECSWTPTKAKSGSALQKIRTAWSLDLRHPGNATRKTCSICCARFLTTNGGSPQRFTRNAVTARTSPLNVGKQVENGTLHGSPVA